MDGARLQAQPWEAQSCSPLPRLPDRRHVASEPPPPPAQPFPLDCLPQTHWPPPPELWTPRPWEELLGAVPGTEGSGRLTAPPKAESRLGWERRAAWGASPRLAGNEHGQRRPLPLRPGKAPDGLGWPAPLVVSPAQYCPQLAVHAALGHTPGQAPAPQQGLDPRTPSRAQVGQRQGGVPEVSPPW